MSIFPLIIAVVWILRAISSSSGGNGTQIPSWVGWLILKLVLYGIAWAIFADRSEILKDMLLAAAVFVFMPNTMIETIFIPLGMYRTVYWMFNYLKPSGYDDQYQLGACVSAAMALARKRNPERGREWLAEQLPQVASSLAGYDMLIGLLAAIGRDRETAHAVFHLIDTTQAPRALRRAARDWLVADAAARGDWQEVIWRGRRPNDSYRWSYAVARMGERITHRAEAPSDWLLIVLWLVAPRRRRLLPLLRQARGLPRAPTPATKSARPLNWRDAIAPLGAMLCGMEHGGAAPQRAQFVSAIQDAAANLAVPSMRTRIEERLRKLDPNLSAPGNVDAVMAAMRVQLAQLAHTLIEQAPQLAEGGEERPVVGEAIEGLRQRAMQDIATRAQDFAQRSTHRKALSHAQEWAAWGNLRARAESLLRLAPQSEDSLFGAMYTPLCNYAVFQHNERQQHRLAHDIFCWLHRHAASNPEALDLLSKNAKAFSGMRKR